MFLSVVHGSLTTCVSPSPAGAADVVLKCELVEDGAGRGSAFVHSPATLVLRDVPVTLEDSEETLPPFVPPPFPVPDLVLIEVEASSVHIPNAEVLLHADCNEQEVMCEISRYATTGPREDPDPVYFIVTLTVGGAEVSTSLILRTLTVEKNHLTVVQKNLGLPLSPRGSLLTNVVFLVFSLRKLVSSSLGDDILLDCGFKHDDASRTQEVDVEWRLQHRGKGQRVFEMRTRMEGDATVERKNSSVDAARVVAQGNVSLTLNRVKVTDEGMYICSVTLGKFQAQQTIQLFVQQPPQVSISEEKLVLRTASPQVLRCHCSKYYPLSAQMEWFSLSPTDTEPVVFPDQGSLSSHRQHNDGTFSLSSHLVVPSTLTPGTKIICRVSHPALDAPVSVRTEVEGSEPDSYWWFVGFLIITVLFFYQVMR
uniref:TAP binding protein like n=1 Tax=Cynoglossus semilaevis TaxID=244447 RepID=A0A3P8X033_CYNSE